MSSQEHPPNNLSHAFELYGQAKAIIQYAKPLDDHKARVLVKIANDAIKEFGNTNQEKVVELEEMIGEAAKVLPPATIEELRKRAEGHILRTVHPKKPILRTILLTAIGLALIVSAGLAALRYLPSYKPHNDSPVSNDPLGIAGKWTYITEFRDDDFDSATRKYDAVKGENTVISADRDGYTMKGFRTHYKKKDSGSFLEYPNSLIIEFSRVSFSPDRNSFYFHFKVNGREEVDRTEGFVDMKIHQPSKSKMEGVIHYLHSDRTWGKAHITFIRQE